MDKSNLIDLIKKREQGEFEDPIGFDAYVHSIANCMGKDRNDVIAFIRNEQADYVSALSEAYEEIMDNFPGDEELNDLFIQYVLP